MPYSIQQLGRWTGMLVCIAIAGRLLLSKASFLFFDSYAEFSFGLAELFDMRYQILFALPFLCVAWLCWRQNYVGILIVAAAVLAVILGCLLQSVLIAYQLPAFVVWTVPFVLAITCFRLARRSLVHKFRQEEAGSEPADPR